MIQRPKSKSPHSSFFTLSSLDVKTLALFKMGRRAFLKPTILFTLLFLLALVFFFSINPSNYDSDPTRFDIQEKRLKVDGELESRKVRVYMYDLPRKFTYGVIESYVKARNGDVLKLKYPGNQHPAEWYLFDDLNRPDRTGSPVTRVMDPDEADLFYVPFFSSLSLVVNPIRPAGIVGPTVQYNDEAMQEGLVEWLEDQVYWKRNNGWDHVFICQDPNALYKVVDRVKNGVLLVSDFGRLGRDQASLVKDVILPYSHRINTFKGDVGVENRKSFLFFMGNRFRKEVIVVSNNCFMLCVFMHLV